MCALSKLHCFLRYENLDEVNEIVGKQITYPKELGLKRDETQENLHHVGDGPKAFFLSSAGAYTDLEIQEMVEKKVTDQNYWMDKKKLGRVKTQKRLLMFEISQGLYSFELGSGARSLNREVLVSRKNQSNTKLSVRNERVSQ